jgi:hypothetical protein
MALSGRINRLYRSAPTDRATSTQWPQWKPRARATLPLPVLNFNTGTGSRGCPAPTGIQVRWKSSMARSEPLELAGSGLFGLHREGAAGLGASDAPPTASGRRSDSQSERPRRRGPSPQNWARAWVHARPLLGPVCHGGALEVPYWQRADGNHGARRRGEPKAGLCPGLPVALGHSGHPASNLKPEPRRAAGTMRYR